MPALKDLTEQGVSVLHQLISSEQAQHCYEKIVDTIAWCANDFKCSVEDYLMSVSRWAENSPVIRCLGSVIESMIKPKLESLIQQSLVLVKANVICKNRHARYPIPCHQDISYQGETTYDFTSWLALNSISQDDGPLTCLPKSHLDAIQPAVDFWDPEYFDAMFHSHRWQTEAKAYAVNSGDAILFSSATWHGSLPSQSDKDRYALVTRWRLSQLPRRFQIPKKSLARFGMWNCYEQTVKRLSELLYQHELSPAQKFVDLLEQVKAMVPNLDYLSEKAAAKRALYQLQLLHRASEMHDGGDAHGKVYANVWRYLLRDLTRSRENAKNTKVTGDTYELS